MPISNPTHLTCKSKEKQRDPKNPIKRFYATRQVVIYESGSTNILPNQEAVPEGRLIILLNKPKDYETTVSDPHAKNTVMDLVRNACNERIYPVGRLDKNTTGLLLFTNDGELTKQLTHPKYEKLKVYHAFLDKSLDEEHIKVLLDGIELEDGFIKADNLNYTSAENKNEVGIELHSGKNRIVRRMFEHLGYKVTKLDRVYFAGLTKKNLPRGRWRHLTPREIAMLKMKAYK